MTAYDELIPETARTADGHAPVEARGYEDLAPELPASVEVADEPVLAIAPSGQKKSLTSIVLGRLIAVLTTQSVIVTVLAALTAVTVAAEAAKIINAKLDLIVTALKRL